MCAEECEVRGTVLTDRERKSQNEDHKPHSAVHTSEQGTCRNEANGKDSSHDLQSQQGREVALLVTALREFSSNNQRNPKIEQIRKQCDESKCEGESS